MYRVTEHRWIWRPRACAAAIAVLLTPVGAPLCYDQPAHQAMTRAAVEADAIAGGNSSVVQDYIQRVAGDNLPPAIPSVVGVESLADGADAEDKGTRPLNHFNNPLTGAGGTDARAFIPATNGLPSPAWAQSGNNKSAWQDARTALVEAISGASAATRRNAAKTVFRILGQQVHLVQDAASPPHGRRDPHPFVLPAPDHTVTTPDVVRTIVSGSQIQPLGQNLLRMRALFPIPIANLIDAGRYQMSRSCDQRLGTAGISEFTATHFFSRNTLPKADPQTGALSLPTAFPCPGPMSAVMCTQGGDCSYDPPDLAPYLAFRLEAGGTTRKPPFKTELTNDIARLHANTLVPAAVGYSRAQLDYFFRAVNRLDLFVAFSDKFGGFLGVVNNTQETLRSGDFQLILEKNGVRRADFTMTLDTPLKQGEFQLLFGPGSGARDLGDALNQLINAGTGLFGVVFKGSMGPESDPAAAEPNAIASRICMARSFEMNGERFFGCTIQTPGFI